MEDTCIIEPDLENEIEKENENEEEEEEEAEKSSTKAGDNAESLALNFLVKEDEEVADVKLDEESLIQVAEVKPSSSGPVEIEKDQFWEEFPEIGEGIKTDQEKMSIEKENAKENVRRRKRKEDKDIEKEEVDDEVKEVEVAVEVDDEVEEVGFAAQAVASLGFSLGLTVYGSALVFPAVALPRLKQVDFILVFIFLHAKDLFKSTF